MDVPGSDAFLQDCSLNCACFTPRLPRVYWGWHSRKQVSSLCSLPLVPSSKQSRKFELTFLPRTLETVPTQTFA